MGGIFIDGGWSPSAAGAVLPVIDPSTGEPFGEIADGDETDSSARFRPRAGPSRTAPGAS